MCAQNKRTGKKIFPGPKIKTNDKKIVLKNKYIKQIAEEIYHRGN